ncbi:hypothetical protein HMPREF0183_1911 [Brevibacterium mcbrellneri ATCC 49030]|uniref:Uncharacterized protein n=1 Tax=Brevibacterium mcbrellneri ATCC 49030 TaxID=585530 RepID=D4YPQ1_9MICO|nr:hypothetical protein HMPREF0183_1911 [Brevibacterium mcbrellneri ATCC 49030]
MSVLHLSPKAILKNTVPLLLLRDFPQMQLSTLLYFQVTLLTLGTPGIIGM